MDILLPILLYVVVLAGVYVWLALALRAVFLKAGVPGWKAWVPVYNQSTLFLLGRRSGWWPVVGVVGGAVAGGLIGTGTPMLVIGSLRGDAEAVGAGVLLALGGYLVSLVVTVLCTIFLVLALNEVNRGFGVSLWFTLLGVLLLPVWASVIGWGGATWRRSDARAAEAPRPAPPSPLPSSPFSLGQPAAGAPGYGPASSSPTIESLASGYAPQGADVLAGRGPVPPPPPPPPGLAPASGATPFVPPPAPPAPVEPAPPAPPALGVRPADPFRGPVAPPVAAPAPVVEPAPAAAPAPPDPWAPPPVIDAVPVAAPPAAPAAAVPAPAAPAIDLGAPASAAPPQAAPEEDDEAERTVLAARNRPAATLRLPDGRSVAITEAVVVLGRNPVAPEDAAAAQLVSVADTTRTVSKTHALLRLRDGAWSVTDLGSTNGVVLVDPSGAERELEVGVAAPLTARFFLGEAELTIDPGV